MELKTIKKVLYKELESLYHKREVYDKDEIVKDNKDSLFSEEEG